MEGEPRFKCYYCETTTNDFNDIIYHSVELHTSQLLKIKIVNHTQSNTRNFNVIPQDLINLGKVIYPSSDSLSLKISRPPETPSPLHREKKRFKPELLERRTSTPKKLDFFFNENETLIAEKIEDLSLDEPEARNVHG